MAASVFPAIDNLPNWNSVSPRFGAAYDLFGNGKTAINRDFAVDCDGHRTLPGTANAVPAETPTSAGTSPDDELFEYAGHEGNRAPDMILKR